ncbi:DEAD/DEAH box helicase, partial [Candidatus Gracilibacteria bacterium]|nr:DEAD/DEAH box helicase [Candidatus Gracilibacteria bacterium]
MPQKHPQSLALGLDFAPDFERIRREHSPIEINQITDPAHPPVGVEYVECETLSELVEFLKDKREKIKEKKWRNIILTKQPSVMEKFCADNDIEAEIHAWKLGGPSFVMPMKNEEGIMKNGEGIMKNGGGVCVITDELIGPLLGGVFRRKKKRPQLDLLVQIKAGDPVVHLFHGVGIFQGIVRNTLSGMEREYIEIEYAEKDRLFVPVEELHRVSKFVGESTPTLTRLGSPAWKLILAKTNEEIQKIAEELLANHAARRMAGGVSMMDFPEKEETFHIAFPHKHTLDQEEAIHGIMSDMKSEKPMDRLLSGDVGFGKTEVSLHAVYRAFLNEKQTIFLAPLVVLAYEHYESIRERLKPFGVNVAMMTRMSTTQEIKAVLAGLKDGSIHCVIGTHRLLSPDIKFQNLGLVVVDEEHKFGVTDKEKILHLKAGVDTLALSATPIPRSLNLALSG